MSRSGNKLESIATAVMAICAIVVTVVIVSRTGSGSAAAPAPERLELSKADWNAALAGSHKSGSASAPVQLVLLADFQCPACRSFVIQVLPKIRTEFGEQLAVTYRYWPLPYHPQALPAAYAAECAGAQGRFWALHDTLYAQQAVLGQKTYATMAAEAGVEDTVAFNACVALPATAAVIARDQELAKQLGGQGTPTIIVNGTILKSGALESVLSKEIKAQISKHS